MIHHAAPGPIQGTVVPRCSNVTTRQAPPPGEAGARHSAADPPATPGAAGRSRPGRNRHPAHQFRHDHRTSGQRLADSVTAVFGSWRFIIVQTVIVAMWITANIVAIAYRWDPYPFILPNLLFSTRAV